MATMQIHRPLQIWGRVYSTFFQNALVYKANAVIWMMTDVVPALVMPLLWLASYNGRPTIGGMTPSQMVVYYMVVLFVTCIVESHVMWDMSNDIKIGMFNVYLTRPFSFRGYMYADNLSWRLMRTFIFVPLFVFVLFLFKRWVSWDPSLYHYGWSFWLAIGLAHVLSFSISYALGLLALYFVETHSIYMFYYLPLIIFSGQIAPIQFFPHAIARVAMFLPFGYTLWFPARIFLGQVDGHGLMVGFGMQIVWIAIAWLAGVLLWKGGLKRYTGYGI